MASSAKRLSQKLSKALSFEKSKEGSQQRDVENESADRKNGEDSDGAGSKTAAKTKKEDKGQKGGLMSRIAAFEKAASDAADPKVMAAKISAFSDRKKYNFADGLKRDLEHTRAALRACAGDGTSCTFGDLFAFTEGKIANLNRILQNLKKAGEVSFEPEVFFEGMHDKAEIALLEKFWEGDYTVNAENVFRPGRNQKEVPEEERKGRSYVVENLKTRDVKTCHICDEEVDTNSRITVRDRVYHMRCIKCVVCGSSPREKADFVTFDGKLCCGVECIKTYDGAHQKQARS